ncbi:MAG: hypothetical protein GH147_02985, partial [Clostridia bacterium]|nr:hypothetical protein [Clostridia bacterium]
MRIRIILLFLIMLLISTGVARATVTDNPSDLIVPAGESYTLDGSHTYTNSVQIDGTLYVIPYDGTGNTGRLELVAPVITINGSINIDGKGYQGGLKTQVGTRDGDGPGGGKSANDGGGAGYGGNGGEHQSGTGGIAYGSITQPGELGSGGGGGFYSDGGEGGGTIRIDVSSTLTINGIIKANGGSNVATRNYYGGGGSGGSIYIVTNVLAGNGCIKANGGDGTNGGAGGRIAIYYTTDSYTGTISAYGGTGYYKCGGAGTIFTKSSSQAYGDLLIDNNNNEGVTPIVDGTYTFDSVVIKNCFRRSIVQSNSKRFYFLFIIHIVNAIIFN